MANNFSGDSSCEAVWDMEDGGLTTDTGPVGTNTLTDNNTVTNDTTNMRIGDGCGDFTEANLESLSILDSALSADFPLRVVVVVVGAAVVVVVVVVPS